jgi:uncharacterized protein
VRLFVRVSPGASCDRIGAIERDAVGQERLALRVTAAPEDGAANQRVMALVADALRVPKSALTVRQGAHARNKSLDIVGETQQLMASITALVGDRT